MNDDFLWGLIWGIILSLFMGVFVATDDDITQDQIAAAMEVCGGWEKISYFDTDGDDTFVCVDGQEYAFDSTPLYITVKEWRKKKRK